MTYPTEAPPHWNRFLQLVHHNAPQMPHTAQTELQHDRARAGQVLGVVTTLLGALGVRIPDSVDNIVSYGGAAVTANDAAEFASSVADNVVSGAAASFAGGPAGLIVGNGIAVLRGAIQALERSDAMVTYLLGMSGYTVTLARLAIHSTEDAVPYLTMPTPEVPQDILNRGDLFAAWRRRAYLRGYNAARRVKESIDEVTPTDGDHYSKRIFIHLYLQGNRNLHMPQGSEHAWRVRTEIEDYLLRRILSVDLMHQREQLRRWAMQG